jgi:hypothetical protein
VADRECEQCVLKDLGAIQQLLDLGSDGGGKRLNRGCHQLELLIDVLELLTDVTVDGLVGSGDENFVSLKVVGHCRDPMPLAIQVLFVSADRVGMQTLVALDRIKAVREVLNDGLEVGPVLGSQRSYFVLTFQTELISCQQTSEFGG